MKILVFGGTGLIGQALCQHLMLNNHQPVIISRNPDEYNLPYQVLGYSTSKYRGLINITKEKYGIVNLAGEGIADEKWTKSRKDFLLHSRIDSIDRIELIIQQAAQEPEVFIQSSAIGYYGDTGNTETNEDGEKGEGFLSDLTQQWEERFLRVNLEDTRKVLARIGIVLTTQGGMLGKMLPVFKKGVGGVLGKGTQGVSWIHIQDAIRAITFLIENDLTRDVYNLVAPTPVSMKEFTKQLAKQLHKPALFKVPAFALKAMYGQMATETILQGSFVEPKKLLKAGFEFAFSDLDMALMGLLTSKIKK